MLTSHTFGPSGQIPPFNGLRAESPRLPLARLIQILVILQSERFPNARRLAEACEVSRRTIYRDLATLEAAGIDVLFQPERQGYQLARDCWLQPTQLEESEALALVILSRHHGANAPAELARNARSGLAKVVLALPTEVRNRVTAGSELIAETRCDREQSRNDRAIHETILRALSTRRRLALWHRRHEIGPVEATKLGLYRLANVNGAFCLVGHSSADRRIQLFTVARIDRLESTDEVYTIPPRFRLERFLESFHGDTHKQSAECR